VFETDRHVKDHCAEGNEYVEQCILRYFGTDDSTDRFHTLELCLSDFAADIRNDRLCFFRAQVLCPDDDIITGFALNILAGKLDDCRLKTVLAKTVSDLFDSDRLAKSQFKDGAAGKINAPVKTEGNDGNDGEYDQNP